MAVKKTGEKGAKAPQKKAAATRAAAKKPAKAVKAAARPAKTAAKTKRPAARKPAGSAAPKEARYGCEVCGLMVTVDEWGDMNMVNIVCCGEQMQPV